MSKKAFLRFILILLVTLVCRDVSMGQEFGKGESSHNPGQSAAVTDAELVAQATAALEQNDDARAISILKRGADAGLPECTYYMGIYYVARNQFSDAYDYFLRAALLGQLEAQLQLGLAYGEGKGTEKDVSKTVFWLGTAAKAGHESAIDICKGQGIDYQSDKFGLSRSNLVFHGYPWGEASPEDQTQPSVPTDAELSAQAEAALKRGDFDTAVSILTEGVIAGYPSCAYDLGLMRYLAGAYSVSYGLFLQASLAGHPDAQYMLGTMYSQGQGVKKDLQKSIFWMGTAAKSGQEYALAFCAENGISYKKDYYGLSTENLRTFGYQR